MSNGNVQFQLGVAVAGALFAGVMWFAFLRQVPEKAARARIVSKEAYGPYSITSHPNGQAYWNSRTLHIPGGFRFGIEVPGSAKLFAYGLDSLAAREFTIGQEVEVRYEERGLPPFWKKMQVKSMAPAAAP